MTPNLRTAADDGGRTCRLPNFVSSTAPLNCGDAGCLTQCHRSSVSVSCHFFVCPARSPSRCSRLCNPSKRSPVPFVTVTTAPSISRSPLERYTRTDRIRCGTGELNDRTCPHSAVMKSLHPVHSLCKVLRRRRRHRKCVTRPRDVASRPARALSGPVLRFGVVASGGVKVVGETRSATPLPERRNSSTRSSSSAMRTSSFWLLLLRVAPKERRNRDGRTTLS